MEKKIRGDGYEYKIIKRNFLGYGKEWAQEWEDGDAIEKENIENATSVFSGWEIVHAHTYESKINGSSYHPQFFVLRRKLDGDNDTISV